MYSRRASLPNCANSAGIYLYIQNACQ